MICESWKPSIHSTLSWRNNIIVWAVSRHKYTKLIGFKVSKPMIIQKLFLFWVHIPMHQKLDHLLFLENFQPLELFWYHRFNIPKAKSLTILILGNHCIHVFVRKKILVFSDLCWHHDCHITAGKVLLRNKLVPEHSLVFCCDVHRNVTTDWHCNH